MPIRSMPNSCECKIPDIAKSEAIDKAKNIWDYLCKEFDKSGNPIEFNFKNNVRDIFQGNYTNCSLHYIHPYPGKIFPYIPAFLLSVPQLCPADGVILDPFSGSGTVLLESIIHPLHKRDAYGVEINPLGRLISKVKTTPLGEDKLSERTKCLLNKLRSNDIIITKTHTFDNIDFWFSPKSIRRLSNLMASINTLKSDDYKDFFFVCFSSIIRKLSNADPFIPPPVKLDINKYNRSPEKYKYLQNYLVNVKKANVEKLFKNAISENKVKILRLNTIGKTADKPATAHIIWDDAKVIKRGKLGIKGCLNKRSSHYLRKNSIDLIMTSPPYLTAQKYIRTHKLEIQWLNMLDHKGICNLQRDIIGAERVSSTRININTKFGVESIDALINWANSISKDRASAIACYFKDMKKALKEMYRVLKKDAYCVIVVGNNHVLGKYIETYRLLRDLALDVGFELKIILKDMIRGRGMITKRHNSGGLIKEEYVIILKKKAGK